MLNDKHRFPIGFLKLLDLGLIVLSFGLATVLIVQHDGDISLADFLSMRIKVSNFAIFALALFTCYLVFSMCGLYRSRRFSSRTGEIADLLKATTLSVACFVVIGTAFTVRMITLPFLAIFWVISTAVLCSVHLFLRTALEHVRSHGRNLRHMLVLGTNPRAMRFAHKINASRERGYHLLGFVDDPWLGMAEFNLSGFPLVSDLEGLAEFLRQNVVDEVAIYLPFSSFYRHSAEVASLCALHGIIMRFNSDIFGLKTTRWQAEEFDGDYFIATSKKVGDGWPRLVKRTVDIVVSALLIVVLSPVLLAAALAIRLTSPGPVFFLQERIGRNKRKFRIYKFRTMIPNAQQVMAELEASNEVSGPVFKIKNDPRITPIGKFLRRSSIDELPQLFNVLQGDMSLVGPRPLPVRDYEGFSEDWQRRRFSIKPGITCLWQVKGRSEISFDQWMLLDLQYLDEWSLWLDFKILAQTVPAVVRGAGAA